MIFIAHRANLDGPSRDENSPAAIYAALAQGFDVKVDVWHVDGKFLLGHNEPKYGAALDFLTSQGVWCQAMSPAALDALLEIGSHCLFHQTDDVTLTSMGFIWGYPAHVPAKRSVCVLPEKYGGHDWRKFEAVCTDYPLRCRKEIISQEIIA